MANVKVTALSSLVAGDSAATDVLPIVDVSADATKKLAISDLHRSVPDGTLSAPGIAFQSDLNSGLYRSGTDAIALVTNGAARILIDATGNVTIPNDLTVEGTTTFIDSQTLRIEDKNIELGVVTTPTDTTADGGGITLKGATDKTITWVNSTGAWTFNQPVNMTGGNVGIGTTSPAGKLTLKTTNSNGAPVAWDNSYFVISEGDTSTSFGLGLSLDTTNNEAQISSLTPNTQWDPINYRASQHKFFVTDASSNEAMRINSSGNVGIGTTSPSNLLHLNASSDTAIRLDRGGTKQLNIGTDSVQSFIASFESKPLAFATSTSSAYTERMRIDSSGNVGIGETTTVAAGLDVKRDVNPVLAIDRGTANTANFNLQYNGTLTGQLSAANGDFQISAGASTPISFYTGGTEQVRIDSNGRLAIGTSTYAGNGQVAIAGNSNNSAAAGILDIRPTLSRPTATDTTLSLIRFGSADHTSNTGYASINMASDGASASDSDLPGRLEFHTTNDGASSPTEKMRISNNADGQLLIGTTSGSNSANTGVKLKGGDEATVDVVTNTANNINLHHVYNINATRNGYRYYLSIDGGIRNFSSNNVNLSDEREKKNIVDMDSTWNDLKQWTLRQFHFNDQDDSEDKRYGVIAQQIESISPQVLSTFDISPEVTRKGVKETQMMWMAIKALQEAQARIETLEAKVAALES